MIFFNVNGKGCSVTHHCFVLSCHAEISQTRMLHAHILVSLESSHWVQVHWLETVWSYCVEEAIDYWTIFSTKTKKNSTLKTILEYGVKDFLFFIFYFLEWILLLEIQTNCKNWVWKEKSVWALNVFTLDSTAQATLVPHEIKKKKNP